MGLIQTKSVRAPGKWRTKGIGTQTDLLPRQQESRDNGRDKIILVLAEDVGYEKLAGILDTKWPADIFRRTVAVSGDPELQDTVGDVAILLDPKQENHAVEMLEKKFRGLKNVVLGNDGRIDYLYQMAFSRTGNSPSEEEYILPVAIDKTGKSDTLEVYERLRPLEVAKVHPTKTLTLIVIEGLNKMFVRKVAEYVLAQTDLTMKVSFAGGRKDKRQDAQTPIRRARKEEGVVTIRGEGRSYADLVRDVKKQVDISKLDIKVNRIRKSDRGDLELSVAGGGEKAKVFQKEIHEKMEGCVAKLNF